MTTTRIRAFFIGGVSSRCRILFARLVGTFCGFAVLGLTASLAVRTVHARSAAEPPLQGAAQPPDARQPAARSARVFASDAGVVLNFIKPDKTGDFEAVMAKLREALQKSEKPERRRQAVGWKVFKAAEPGANGTVLYVFDIDPAVKGADYTVSSILAEAFPSEVQTLYQQYAGAYATGQNIVKPERRCRPGSAMKGLSEPEVPQPGCMRAFRPVELAGCLWTPGPAEQAGQMIPK